MGEGSQSAGRGPFSTRRSSATEALQLTAAQESHTLPEDVGPPLKIVQTPQGAGFPAVKKAQPAQVFFGSCDRG